jgi:MFS family permease
MVCLLFILSQFYRASIAVIAPNLMSDLGLDTGGLSLVSASFFYAFALMQIPISMYLDAIGPRITITCLSMVGVAGALTFACGDSIGTLVAGRLLLGVGMACNMMGALKLITLWFGPLRFATISAIILSIGTMGNMIAATPLVLMVASIGWRTTFMVFAGVNLLLAAVFFHVVRDRPKEAPYGGLPEKVSTSLREILANMLLLVRQRDYWLMSVNTFCRYGIFAAVQALWAGPYLMTVMGIAPVAAGNVLLAMGIGLVVGSPVCGWLSDSWFKTRKRVIMAGLGGMGVVLAVLAILPPGIDPLLLSALFFGFGFFAGAGQIVFAHIKERMPLPLAGTAMTGVNFFTMVGSAAFLQGLGSLMQCFYPGESLGGPAFRAAFLFCAACLLFTSAIYGFTVETIGKRRGRPGG